MQPNMSECRPNTSSTRLKTNKLQSLNMRNYMDSRSFETYSDQARSGIDLAHRPGLRQLLQDIVAAKAAYQAILVFDVSRWGRFQDADESAYLRVLLQTRGSPGPLLRGVLH